MVSDSARSAEPASLIRTILGGTLIVGLLDIGEVILRSSPLRL